MREVRLETCRIAGFRANDNNPDAAVVEIHNATNVYVGNSSFEALRTETRGAVNKVFNGIGLLEDLYATDDWREFADQVRSTAAELAALPLATRQDIWRQTLFPITALHLDRLSMGEENAYRRFAYALLREDVDPLELIDHMIALREEVVRAQPGVALEIGWTIEKSPNPGIDLELRSLSNPGRARAGEVVIENNVFTGNLSFYGRANLDRPLTDNHLGRLKRLLVNNGEERITLIDGLLGVAQLRGNHLTRVLISRDMADALRQLATVGGRAVFEMLCKSMHCTDNIVDGIESVFVAEHVSLASNNFTLDAVRGLASDDVGQTIMSALAIGDSGIYVGNHGRGMIPTAQTVLRDVTRTSVGTANLEIAISS